MSLNKERISEFTEECLGGENENDDFCLSDKEVVRTWVRFLNKRGLNPTQEHNILYTPQKFKNLEEFENVDKYFLVWRPEIVYQKESETLIRAYIGVGDYHPAGDSNVRVRTFENIK